MPVVKQPVEHGAHRRHISQQLAPVFYRTIYCGVQFYAESGEEGTETGLAFKGVTTAAVRKDFA